MLTKCPKIISNYIGRCRVVVLVPKIGYIINSRKQGLSCIHFKFSDLNPPFASKPIFGVFIMDMHDVMYFTRSFDGPSIQKYIAHYKLVSR